MTDTANQPQPQHPGTLHAADRGEPAEHNEQVDPTPDAEADEAARRAAEVARELEEAPENLPPKAWITLGIFALFVVGTGGCMVNLFVN
ncbi:MAG: hypothetical protein ACTH31_09835 [Pseudoclavibacter sp.]